MTAKNFFKRELYGVVVPQRKTDGYISATAISAAFLSLGEDRKCDINHWLNTKEANRAISYLSRRTKIPVLKLVELKKGVYAGTFIHPKLAIRFGMWLSEDVGFLIDEWVEHWKETCTAPLTQSELERMEYRDNLKDESRIRLTNQVKRHLDKLRRYIPGDKRTRWYFARVHDTINIALTGESSKIMRTRLSKLLGKEVKNYELIRDYFPAMVLQRYIAICETTTNLIRENAEPLDAVDRAAKLCLPEDYQPEPIDFTSHIKLIRQKVG